MGLPFDKRTFIRVLKAKQVFTPEQVEAMGDAFEASVDNHAATAEIIRLRRIIDELVDAAPEVFDRAGVSLFSLLSRKE